MARRPARLEKPLRPTSGWGGRRANAGRKKRPGSGLPHASREEFSSTAPIYVTVRLLPELSSLRTKSLARAIERTFAGGCDRSMFRLVHYSLRGDRAHFIVEADDQNALGRGMMAIGSRLALAVNRVLRRPRGRVFADRYHARLLRSPREVHQALRDVLVNATKHSTKSRAPATRQSAALASSGRWFDGWKPNAAVTEDDRASAALAPPPVARARTRLLRIGWRRHGLLDPAAADD